MTVEQVSDALGIGVTKLRPLLYSLVLVGLLTVENARFSNTEETNHFLRRKALHTWEPGKAPGLFSGMQPSKLPNPSGLACLKLCTTGLTHRKSRNDGFVVFTGTPLPQDGIWQLGTIFHPGNAC